MGSATERVFEEGLGKVALKTGARLGGDKGKVGGKPLEAKKKDGFRRIRLGGPIAWVKKASTPCEKKKSEEGAPR